jgi:uncharacterized membrane protein
MKKVRYTLLMLFASAIIISCSKDDNGDNDQNNAGPKFTAVKAIVNSKCAISGCHVSPSNTGGYNFESDANIVAHGAQIKEVTVDLGIMPPPYNAQLSDDEKAKITDWINAGGRLTD